MAEMLALLEVPVQPAHRHALGERASAAWERRSASSSTWLASWWARLGWPQAFRMSAMVSRLESGVPIAMSNSASILLQLISAYCFGLILIGNLSPLDTPAAIGQRDSDLLDQSGLPYGESLCPQGVRDPSRWRARGRGLRFSSPTGFPAPGLSTGLWCLAQHPAPVDLPRPGRTMQLRVRLTAWLRDLAYRPEFST